MYFEAVFSFYVLLYHFVGHSFFGLIAFRSFSNIIKRNFSITFAKLNFYVDMSVWLFVGKQYHRLHMARYLDNDVTIVPVLGNKSTLFSVRGNISTPCPFLRFTHIICAFCYPYQSLNRRSKRKQVYKLISRLPYIMQAILVSTLVTVSTFLQFWETFHQWQMCAF